MNLIIIILLFLSFFIFINILGLLFKVDFNNFKKYFYINIVGLFYLIFIIHLSPIDFISAGFVIGNYRIGIIMFIIGLLINIFFIFITSKKELKYIFSNMNIDFKDKYLLLYILILVGPIEELLFRSFLQANIHNVFEISFFNINLSTIFASLLFIFVHSFNYFLKIENKRTFLILLPGRIIMGFYLGIIFQVTKSIIYPILVHNLSDFLSVLKIRQSYNEK